MCVHVKRAIYIFFDENPNNAKELALYETFKQARSWNRHGHVIHV